MMTSNPRLEADLVLLTSCDEQHVRVLDVQELFDGVLPPFLAAVRQRLAPSVIGVNSLVAAGIKRRDDAGLPVPDMPVSKTRFTVGRLRRRRGCRMVSSPSAVARRRQGGFRVTW